MTTSNKIQTKTLQNVLFVPLEAIHNSDSLTYVYKEKSSGGLVKQEIITGDFNENDIVIKYGVKKGEVISLSVPEKADDLEIVRLSEEDKIAYQKEQAALKRKLEQQALEAQKMKEKKELMSNSGGATKVIIQN